MIMVKCVKSKNDYFTKGRIYQVVDGTLVGNRGVTWGCHFTNVQQVIEYPPFRGCQVFEAISVVEVQPGKQKLGLLAKIKSFFRRGK